MEELKNIEEIHARQKKVEQELTQLMVQLTNYAVEGAQITREDVLQVRNDFGTTQLEQMVRTFQLEEFEHTGNLEGSLMRALDYLGSLGI